MVIKEVHSSFPLIDISGSPKERGRQYGEYAKTFISISIDNYKEAFLREAGLTWDDAKSMAANLVPMLRQQEPNLFEEIEAIASGSAYMVEEILALNTRTEILYRNAPYRQEVIDGCTGAIVLPESSINGHLLHGQNWDWRDECADSSVVLRVTPDKGPRMLIHTEAGNLARCGMNEHGIALTGNFLKTDKEGEQGVPIPFIRRKILSAENYHNAISQVFCSKLSFSNNMMISDRYGEAINLEATPGEVFWISPTDGLLVHANHFISQGALAKVKDCGLLVTPDSLYRHRRTYDNLKKGTGRLSMDDLKTVFQDDFGHPYSVCASPTSGPGGATSSTIATILMDVTETKMWIAKKPYQKHKYTEYSF